jgi:hypothetical protein
MPYDAHKNFAYSTVATAPSPATTGTSLIVPSGDGSKFPTPPFNATVWPTATNPLTTNAEIIRCTAIVTDTLTIARAQEGSTARSIVTGDQIAATITAKTLTDLETELISFEGDWAAPTTYTDGDVIVYNGVAYLCVGGPTTTTPDPTLWGAAQISKPTYGIALPGSPVDGQEAILVDNVTNPTYQWLFRYNAGSSSAYKWECIGGASTGAETIGTDTTTSTTIVNLSNGPSILIPRAGDWLVEVNAIVSSTLVDVQVYVNAGNSTAATNTVINGSWGQPSVANRWQTAYARGRANGLTSGITLTMKGWGGGPGTHSYQLRRLSITPIRVS